MCLFVPRMPGNSILGKLFKMFQYRSKGYTASKISHQGNFQGIAKQTDMHLLKTRIDNLEKGF